MSLDGLIAEVDELCQADPTTLADKEAVKTLHRQLARLDAATTRATAAYDASGDWEESRARSCASWIAAICNLPLPEARRRISNGRALRHMPLAEEAWLDGDISSAHVADAPSRIIDMGVQRRLFTGATRRAVQLRDRECFHPFCDLPAEDCQVDHVVPYAAGGETTQANGRPACAFHNLDRHRRN